VLSAPVVNGPSLPRVHFFSHHFCSFLALLTALWLLAPNRVCAFSEPELLFTGADCLGLTGNNMGEAVWESPDPINGSQVHSNLRGRLSIDGTSNFYPLVNNMGDVVWTENLGHEWGPSTSTVKGIISGRTVQLASSQESLHATGINDRGEVVMLRSSGNYSDSFIYSSVRGRLTREAAFYESPSLNNRGDVVWVQYYGTGNRQIFKLAAGSSTPEAVTTVTGDYYHPAINDNGEIVWLQSGQIVSNLRGQLTDGALGGSVHSLKIDNCGVVLFGSRNDSTGSTALYRIGGSACVSHPEPNHSREQAAPVSFGDIFTGLTDASANQADWYGFGGVAGDTIHLTVNYDNGAGNQLVLGLYDSAGNLLSGATRSNPAGIDLTAPYGGSYYLKLESQAGRIAYAVSLSKYSSNCGAGPCPEPVVPGDVWMPSINALGEVFWLQNDRATANIQLFSSLRGKLTSDQAQHQAVAGNSLGDLVWVEAVDGPSDKILRGVINGQPVTVAMTENRISFIDINDRGEVVWNETRDDGNSQIFSNLRGQLTRGQISSYQPSINNLGDLVFVRPSQEAGPMQVYLLAAGSTEPVALTSDSLLHYSPSIAESGEVAWAERDPALPGTTRLVTSLRGVLVPYVADGSSVDLNSCGDIVYGSYGAMEGAGIYRLGSNAPCAQSSGATGSYHPEPNDSREQATPVLFGDIFSGVADASANQVDWYRFEAAAGDTIHVTVNYDNSVGNQLTVGLYDNAGNPVSGATRFNPTGIDVTAQYGGSYHLKLEAQTGRIGYAVSLSKYSNNCGVGPCPEVVVTGTDWHPAINSLGEVFWLQLDQATGKEQIFSSLRGQLTSDPVRHTSVAGNNLGDLVWVETDENSIVSTVRGIINDQPVTFASGQYWIYKVDINDHGEVVWSQEGGGSNSQIFSSLRGQITSGPVPSFDASINNRGDVVFVRPPQESGPLQVYLLAAGSTEPVPVTGDSVSHSSPAISDSGEIVWAEYLGQPWPTMRLVSSVRGVLVPYLSATFGLDLNNCGDIVYGDYRPSGSAIYRLGRSAPCMQVPERRYSLAVGKSPANSGKGEVSSTPTGVHLSSTDTMMIVAFPPASTVTLSATPDNNSVFTGWSGACSGTGACQVTMDAAKTVTATFAALPDYTLSLEVNGSGAGMVVSEPSGIFAGSNSSARFRGGSAITLHAIAAPFSVFGGWSGACTGPADCLLTMTADFGTTATFMKDMAHSTYIPRGEGIYSPGIQAAYDASADSDTIRLWGIDFTEAVICAADKKIRIAGGYDEPYSTRDGTTVVRGSLTVSSGLVNLDRLAFK